MRVNARARCLWRGRYDPLCSILLPLALSAGAGYALSRGLHALYLEAAEL